MKKMIFTLVALVMMTVQASAMSYSEAREQALFLTDKMAYELNLTEDQYEAAYEINLDYLMNVNTVDDLYGAYWRYRNLDLSYILLDWQYRAYCDATYFYRPLYWGGGYWHFGIYARYPYRDYFYFGRPRFYTVYRGGHSWYHNGGRSWYRGRRDWGRTHGHSVVGMRDGYRRGDYRNGFDNSRNRSFGNLNNNNFNRNTRGNRSFGGNGVSNIRSNRTRSIGTQRPIRRGTFGNGSRNYTPQSSTRSTVTRQQPSVRSFGGSTRSMNRGSFSRPSTSQRQFSAPSRSNRSFSAPSRSNRSFSAPSRSYSAPSRSFSAPSRSGSFGSGSRSFGGHR